MVAVNVSFVPVWRFADNNNQPLVGGKLFVYQAGTATKTAAYTDSTGTTTLPNPDILNARGESATATGVSTSLWLPPGATYKIVLAPATDTDPPTNPIWTLDNYAVPLSSASSAAGGAILITPVDRETGPTAGAGQSGNHVIMLGLNAGQNSTVNDSIVLGYLALDAGMAQPGGDGTVAIGSRALSAWTTVELGGNGPCVAIGRNALGVATKLNDVTAIGDNCLADVTGSGGVFKGVFIGGNCGIGIQTPAGVAQFNVAIGTDCLGPTASGNSQLQQNVCIGDRAAQFWTQTASVTSCTAVGQLAGTGGFTGAEVVASCTWIGKSAGVGQVGNAVRNTVVGASAATSPTVSSPTDNVFIGANCYSGSNQNTMIGSNLTTAFGSRNIWIGYQAGNGIAGTPSDSLAIETFDGATQRSLVVGNLNTGNIYLGNLPVANRDLDTIATTNAVKITNGVRGAGNPVGGGFLYAIGGALHWVGSAGTNTVIAPA